MHKKTILKFNSPKSVRPAAWLALVVLSFVSFSSTGRAQAWLDENFNSLTAGSALTVGGKCVAVGTAGYATGATGGGAVRLLKAVSVSGTEARWSLSDSYATPRPSGYITFKIQQTPGVTASATGYMTFRLGANDANNLSSGATAWFEARFFNQPYVSSGLTSANANLMTYLGAAGSKIQNNSINNGSSPVKIEIWYNNTSSPMSYTSPATRATVALSANSFVIYAGNALVTAAATGSAIVSSVTTTSATPATSIGKIGFVVGTSQSCDFIVDDIYAADAPPVVTSISITSPNVASGMVGYPFAFPVVADGATTFGGTGFPSGLTINPSTGQISGTPIESGSFTANLTCGNSSGATGSGTLTITIASAPTASPIITSSPSASGNVGVAFSYQISASNTPRSYTAANLPAGLNLNPTTGLISGIPTAVGDATVTLTAENPAGTSSSQDLTISIGIAPPNIFTGSNASLNTPASWSLGSTPTASANPGSYTDLVFSSSAASLTTSSGNVFGKSWNVTNGTSYSFSSVSTAPTTFKIGNNNPVSSPFYNSVAGSNNVLVYLTNGSSVTLTETNAALTNNSSKVALYNSGTMQIGSGSTLSILAPLIETGLNAVATKIGSGKLLLGGSNSVSGGLILEEGVIEATVANSLGAGAVTVNGGELNVSGENAWVGSKALTLSGGRATFSASNNYTGVTTMTGGTLQLSNVAALGGGSSTSTGTFTLSGGIVEALVDYDMGHTYTAATTVGSITFDKLNGQTTTVNGPVTLNATSGATLSLYKLAGNNNSNSVVTKTGDGTLKLMGGTPSGGWIGNWQINAGTLFVNTTSSGALGSNNAVVMNGGNLLFSKGVGSSGTYSGHGQDTALSVQAEATITLDPNPLTPAGANTVSFTNLNIGTQTLHIVKGSSTKSSATDVGYTDPELSFRSASLTGQATLDVAANVETVMQAGSGSGGVTKSGAGLLTLSDSTTVTTSVVDSVTNSVTNTIVNSYTGPTTITAGALALRGSHSSAITIGSSATLQLALVSSSSPTTTQTLALASGAKVRPVGTPTEASYTLVTANGGITGTPVLDTAVVGYDLVKSSDNKSLILQQAQQDGFAQYLVAQSLLPSTAFDAVVNGSKVGLQYAFGSPSGMPQNNGVAAVPVVSGNQLTYTFDVKDDSALTLTYQTSTDLVTWTTWLADKATTITGSSPAPDPGFLKKQVQFTGSGKLFIRINVTR